MADGAAGRADWFGGDGVSRADAAVAPMVNRSVQYELGPDPGSPLGRWHARLRGRPPVAETFAEFDQAAARMAATADLHRTGGGRREYRDHRLEWMICSGSIGVVLTGLFEDTLHFF